MKSGYIVLIIVVVAVIAIGFIMHSNSKHIEELANQINNNNQGGGQGPSDKTNFQSFLEFAGIFAPALLNKLEKKNKPTGAGMGANSPVSGEPNQMSNTSIPGLA